MSNHGTESQLTDNMAMRKYEEARTKVGIKARSGTNLTRVKVNNQKEMRRQRCEDGFGERLQQLRERTSAVINSEA